MKWIKKLLDDDIAFVLAVVNMVLVLMAALVVKIFSHDVHVFAGCAFIAGFVATVFEWIFCRKSDTAPAGACIGMMLGVLFVYFLGV